MYGPQFGFRLRQPYEAWFVDGARHSFPCLKNETWGTRHFSRSQKRDLGHAIVPENIGPSSFS